MKYGMFLFQPNPIELLSAAQAADKLGYESAWMGEHLGFPIELKSIYPYHPSGRPFLPADAPFMDPIVTFGYLAGQTTRIRFATGVLILPLHNPFALAKGIATLDLLSNGRFLLGVGIGWLKEEFDWVGMNWDDRALRSSEYLKLMTELWSSSEPTYSGRTVSSVGFRFEPKPIQQPRPPLIFGGNTEAAFRRAARSGDGWYGVAHSLEEIGDLIRAIRKVEKRYERSRPLELTVSIGRLDADTVKRLTDLGVERAIPSLPRQPYVEELHRFHDSVISRV
jgi:probable F420-dependent oxidoreductase